MTTTHRDRGPLTKQEMAALVARDIVETGELDPEAVVTPSIYVDRVVNVGSVAR